MLPRFTPARWKAPSCLFRCRETAVSKGGPVDVSSRGRMRKPTQVSVRVSRLSRTINSGIAATLNRGTLGREEANSDQETRFSARRRTGLHRKLIFDRAKWINTGYQFGIVRQLVKRGMDYLRTFIWSERLGEGTAESVCAHIRPTQSPMDPAKAGNTR